MPDIDQNITVDITGNTAAIATDYSTSGITNGHVQIVKVAWGPASSTTRVTTTTPLPVDIRAAVAAVGITGAVSGSGNFQMINGLGTGGQALPLIIAGTTSSVYQPVQVSGYVQGVTNGNLIGITGTVTVANVSNVRVQGVTNGIEIGITGGRRLNSNTDSVTVSGIVGVTGGKYSSYYTDSIKIFGGAAGETMIPVTLRDGTGKSIGSSGGALNVNLVGSGFTATVSVGTLIGICQADRNTPFIVAGISSGTPVRVNGQGTSDSVLVTFVGAQPVSVNGPVLVDQSEVISKLNNVISNTAQIATTNTTTANIYNKLNSGDGINTRNVKPGQVYYGFLNVGAGGVPVTFPDSTILYSGITIKAAVSNGTKDVVISGNAAGAGGADSGFPLSAGQTIFIETNNLQNLYFENWSGSGTLKIHYIAS
jgi:hypothetical protein